MTAQVLRDRHNGFVHKNRLAHGGLRLWIEFVCDSKDVNAPFVVVA